MSKNLQSGDTNHHAHWRSIIVLAASLVPWTEGFCSIGFETRSSSFHTFRSARNHPNSNTATAAKGASSVRRKHAFSLCLASDSSRNEGDTEDEDEEEIDLSDQDWCVLQLVAIDLFIACLVFACVKIFH